jgi:molybdate transport system substrate-binding protein
MSRLKGLTPAAGLLALLGVCGCGGEGPPGGGPVLCLAAASTQNAVEEVAAGFTAEGGGAVQVNPDASSKLAQQVVNGAPADLFLSADEKWADYVKEKGFAAEVCPLLGNTLVIVVPRGNPGNVHKPEDLTGPAVNKVAVAGAAVPAGIYARQALTRLKLWDGLEGAKKVVAGENVRVTLAYVERGEAEAGVVYGTDARVSDRVEKAYEFDPATHDRIVYPLVLLKAGAKNEAARKFYERLRSPAAGQVFRKHGFRTLDGG